MNFVAATPTEQVRPVSSKTRERISSAMRRGDPSRRRAPDTSRKASSMLSGSIRGVTSWKMSMTAAEYRV